jgi:hypothetical protein
MGDRRYRGGHGIAVCVMRGRQESYLYSRRRVLSCPDVLLGARNFHLPSRRRSLPVTYVVNPTQVAALGQASLSTN